MPQTTPERRARWPGMDKQAMDYLIHRGFTLYRDWSWNKPSPNYSMTETEIDAVIYLAEEWDFGGVQ